MSSLPLFRVPLPALLLSRVLSLVPPRFASARTSPSLVLLGAVSHLPYFSKVSLKSTLLIITKALTGVGFYVKDQSNVILRNLKISKVLADNGDAIGIQKSSNVWVDHCDLSSDQSHDKDYYDGLLDVTHASEWVTISNTYLHDHVSSGPFHDYKTTGPDGKVS